MDELYTIGEVGIMSINLDLLANVARLRFEGSADEFRAALDAAYPQQAGPWDDLPTDAPGDDDPETGPHEISLDALRLAVDDLTLPKLNSGPPVWWEGVQAPCDVRDCARPGHTRWVGRWPAYVVHLCEVHDARS